MLSNEKNRYRNALEKHGIEKILWQAERKHFLDNEKMYQKAIADLEQPDQIKDAFIEELGKENEKLRDENNLLKGQKQKTVRIRKPPSTDRFKSRRFQHQGKRKKTRRCRRTYRHTLWPVVEEGCITELKEAFVPVAAGKSNSPMCTRQENWWTLKSSSKNREQAYEGRVQIVQQPFPRGIYGTIQSPVQYGENFWRSFPSSTDTAMSGQETAEIISDICGREITMSAERSTTSEKAGGDLGPTVEMIKQN